MLVPALLVSGRIVTASNHGEAFGKLTENEKNNPLVDGFFDPEKQKFISTDKTFYLKKIVMIRHGDSIGFHNSPITEKGKEQSHLVASFIAKKFADFDFICSPFLRCVETGKIIAQASNAECAIDKNLAKQEESEKDEDFAQRIKSLIDCLSKKTILVSHTDVIQMICTLTIFTKPNFIPNCSLTFFDDQKIVWLAKEYKDLPLDENKKIS